MDVKNVSNLLKVIEIFEEIGVKADYLHHHVSQMPLEKNMENEEYQFLKASVKFRLIIKRILEFEYTSFAELRNIQILLMELLFPDEKNKLLIYDDMHNACAPSAQMLSL